MIDRLGGTPLGVWLIQRVVSPVQRWTYRATGGRLFATMGSRRVLLLTTTGRRTGQPRTVPVFYLQDGEAVVICNVNPGFERTNPWVVNLRAHPLAYLQMGQDNRQYRAREATEAEIQRLWPRLLQLWPAYQTHYDRSRQRAVFILEPVA